jgi:DNA-binding NtrC family response regulator
VDFFRLDEAGIGDLIGRVDVLLADCSADVPLALLGDGRAVTQACERVEILSELRAPVLIIGSEGSGRASVARYIHALSGWRNDPFVVASPGLGLNALVDLKRGTCYLPDVHKYSAADQSILVNALIASESQGWDAPIRFVASTTPASRVDNRPGAPGAGAWGLLQRYWVEIPSLEDRLEDFEHLIDVIAEGAAKRLGRTRRHFTMEAVDALKRHPWRSRLSDLETTIHTLVACADGAAIPRESVEILLAAGISPLKQIDRERRNAERDLLIELYRKHGTYSGVARELGITRNAAKYRLAKHSLLPQEPRSPAAGRQR